jgi:hypothetical protein
MPPPKVGLHSNKEKHKTTSMQFIYKSRLDVRILKHKPLETFNTP